MSRQPIIYPCFTDFETKEVLVCASRNNPTRSCPDGYTRVENTFQCKKNESQVKPMPIIRPRPARIEVRAESNVTTQPALVRSGGSDSAIFVSFTLAVMVIAGIKLLFTRA